MRTDDGEELGAGVHEYRHGVIEERLPGADEPLPPDWALQDPEDYREVFRRAVPDAIADAGVSPIDIIGIGIAFTSCTVLPTLKDGTPLCQVPGLSNRPHAYAKLWKHHAARTQANRITELAAQRAEPWLKWYGGRISAEWSMAKGLELLEDDPDLYARTERWIEAADWAVWQLCGKETRSISTAGYKVQRQDDTYPHPDFLAILNARFSNFIDAKIEHPVSKLGRRVGNLTAEASAWTGLPEGIAVATGNIDAHATVPAAQALKPGRMLAMMGTSTCHILNGATKIPIPGICGVVADGVSEGMYGYEAGQSGVGDIFRWFVDHSVPPYVHRLAADRKESVHDVLTGLGADLPVGGHGLLALDWHSGNRSVLGDHGLSGVVIGQTLATRPQHGYRALLEATAFGTRRIIDAFEDHGVPVTDLVAAGGVAQNNFVLQLYADVTCRPLRLIGTSHGPALGAAVHAAVASGCHQDVSAASAAMGRLSSTVISPDEERALAYDKLYAEYKTLHDYFGRGTNEVMHRLREIRKMAVTS